MRPSLFPLTLAALMFLSLPGCALVGVGPIAATVWFVLDSDSGTDGDGGPSVQPPQVISITPSSGPVAGGTPVTLVGARLQDGCQVRIGSGTATLTLCLSDTQITCVTPSCATAGAADVSVENPGGGIGVLPGGFTYVGPPSVASVSPYGGPLAGGTSLTITGSGFSAGAGVRIGDAAAGSVVFVSSTSITCVSPAGTAGLAEVRVSNPDAQYGTLLNAAAATATARGFLYSAAPTVAGVSPSNGRQAGGTSVTITGTGFHRTIASGGEADANPTVTIGGTAATNVSVDDSMTIRCDAPSHAAGDVDVVVTNPDGQSGTGTALYRYNDFPVITSVSPNLVGSGGGTPVTLTGTFLMESVANPPTVMIGGFAATNVTWVSATTVTCVVPALSPPTTPYWYAITLTNPDIQWVTWGTTGGSGPDGIQYDNGPTVVSISPASAPRAGASGTPAATITGTGFSGPCRVWFGTIELTAGQFTVVNSTTITVSQIPDSGGVIGYVDVRVENGTSLSGALTNTFRYLSTLSITNFNPGQGGRTGSVSVTIDGTDFFPGIQVTFGGLSATNVTLTGAGPPYLQLTCDTPIFSTAGPVNVQVTNTDSQFAVAASQYLNISVPTIVSVSPNSGPTAGGTSVTIGGTDFYANPVVTFNGVPATNVACTSPYPAASLTCTSPASTAVGAVAVRVTNTDSGYAEDPTGFTYFSNPTVTGVSPSQGISGSTITVTGTDFFANPTVYIRNPGTSTDFACANVVCSGPYPATTITCSVPSCATAGGAGLNYTVRVVNTDSNAGSLTSAFAYLPNPAGVNPGSGSPAGGETITITCTDGSFLTAASITFGGMSATNVTFVNANTLTCTSPGGTVGTIVNVVVTDPAPSGADPSPHLQFCFGTSQAFEVTTRRDFSLQTLTNLDYGTTPGNVSLAIGPGTLCLHAMGDIVTCVAYWEVSMTANRILVGTASGGAFLTNDGGSTWTAFNIYTHSNFPSNTINCVAFYSEATNSTGNEFMIGTPAGLAITTDGGTSFTVWNTASTPALPNNNVLDVDYCDGAATSGYILISTADPSTSTDAGGCLFSANGGISSTVFNSSNIETGASPQDTNRTASADFLDSDTTGNTFMISCQDVGSSSLGASYKTVNAGTIFARKQVSAWGSAQYHFICRFCPGDGNRYILASSNSGQQPHYTANDGGMWTAITVPANQAYDAAFYDASRYMVATNAGVSITTNGGGAYSTVSTASTGGYANILNNVTRGVAWHRTIGNANNFLIACGTLATNAVDGALEKTTNGGTSFTHHYGSPASSAHLGQPPAVLPSANVTCVAFDPNEPNGNRYAIGTRDGLAYTPDGGATWTWFDGTTANVPSGNVQEISLLTTGGTTYMLVGFQNGLSIWNSGAGTFAPLTSNLVHSTSISGVALFDGTHYAATASGTGALYVNNGGIWSHYDTLSTPNTLGNDVRGVDIFRGTGSMDYVIFGATGFTVGGASVWRLSTTPPTVIVNLNPSNGGVPAITTRCVAFDQSSVSNLRAVIGTAAGASRGINLQSGGTPTYTLYTTGTSPALPSNTVNDCAYFGGNNGNSFMFATSAGLASTNDCWSTVKVVNRSSTGAFLPRNEAQACAYHDGTSTGDRILVGCPASSLTDNGGAMLVAGSQYSSTGTMVISNLDGLLLPTGSVNIPSLPDKNIRGICWYNGDASNQRFVVGTDYGVGLTTDGGMTFASLREPNTPASNALPSNRISCVAFFKGSNQAILVGTSDAGAALTTDGGNTWTQYNTSTTPALPGNNVRWVAFHDGQASPNVFIVCTANGSLYVNGGTNRTITSTSGMNATGHYGADFLDSDVDGTHTFLIGVCASSANGAWLTTDDGVSFTRYYTGTPASFASSTVCTVGWFNNTTWFAGKWPELGGFSGAGNAQRTTDSGANFATFDLSAGLVEDDVRWFSLCDRTAGPTHWMVAGANGTGISYTSNGDLASGTVTFTTLSTATTPALPSNNVLSCAYWNGTGATGATWAVGTALGIMQTTNGGGNLALLHRTPSATPNAYLRIDVVETLNGQTITYDVLDHATGTPIAGYTALTPTAGSIDISGISFTTYPAIRLRANFSTTNSAVTPVLHDIKIVFRYP